MSRLVCTVAAGVVIGVVFGPLSAHAASRDLSLPDISTAFQPVYHLDLRTTTGATGAVDGVALDLSLSHPAITGGLRGSLQGVYTDIGRNDGRSRPRPAPRPRPRPGPHASYHGHMWVPIAIILAVGIAICIPMVMVVYY